MNTELDTNLNLEDQLNKLIAGGQQVELITAQMLQEVAGNSTLNNVRDGYCNTKRQMHSQCVYNNQNGLGSLLKN